MSATEDNVLALDGHLTLDRVVGVWNRVQAHVAGVQIIDLHDVDVIDSAGVALVEALRQAARDRNGVAPVLRGAPARYDALRRAHRLENE